MNYEILVNKDNPIDENYNPGKLVSVGKHFNLSNHVYSDLDVLIEENVANILKTFLDEVNKINKKFVVIANSGFRTFDYQVKVMDYYVKLEGLEKAKKRVAEPGTSEHHTGFAIDLIVFYKGKLLTDINVASKILRFIYNNAHKYGFILRYPKDKENITGYPYEPWHIRYVGINLASYLFKNNMTLEEYHLNKKNNNLGKK